MGFFFFLRLRDDGRDTAQHQEDITDNRPEGHAVWSEIEGNCEIDFFIAQIVSHS